MQGLACKYELKVAIAGMIVIVHNSFIENTCDCSYLFIIVDSMTNCDSCLCYNHPNMVKKDGEVIPYQRNSIYRLLFNVWKKQGLQILRKMLILTNHCIKLSRYCGDKSLDPFHTSDYWLVGGDNFLKKKHCSLWN